ncbi:MAG TPA: phosphatase [Clostridiaceae bacterium]|jgi:putative hydrolase|nr:phosphatase [Clostridiaceae bacterium]
MKLVADCHFHTISSGHAYSTINEYAEEASEKGLELIGMTDHGPAMLGGPHIYHFDNLKVIPDNLHGVEILKGIEANIIGYDGTIDVEDEKLEALNLDIVISSFHSPCLRPSSIKDNTAAVIKSMENRCVNIIGHPDDSRIGLDYTELAKAAADSGVMIEVNNSSLRATSYRLNARENYEILLNECYKYNVYIIINSDAHFHIDIGENYEAFELVKNLGYPKELIANTNIVKLRQRLEIRRR